MTISFTTTGYYRCQYDIDMNLLILMAFNGIQDLSSSRGACLSLGSCLLFSGANTPNINVSWKQCSILQSNFLTSLVNILGEPSFTIEYMNLPWC